MIDTAALVSHTRAVVPSLSAVYLFGSQVNGTAGPESDVDLAILADQAPDAARLWEIAGELADIANRNVDLVDFRTASTIMQYQIITTGRRLWERDSQAAIYESFVLSEKTALDEARAGLIGDIQKRGRVYDG